MMNITDVEDKIIRDAKNADKTIYEFVKPYEKAFYEDLAKLNIQKAWKYPKATRHIKEMVTIIQKLLKRGLAYQQDGSVYFDISKFKKYGRLSRLKKTGLKAGARVDADEYAKEDVQDFVLWKAKKSGEPFWKTPFGEGRPGWHIECSAMSMKYLSPSFDIHAGGVDLIFPHHENEIAQSEGAMGKPFVRYFVEGEHLLVDGAKMSKSLGNIYTLRDIQIKGFNPLAFRYLVLTSHYRSKLNFTWESLKAAQNSLARLHDFIQSNEGRRTSLIGRTASLSLLRFRRQFAAALSNDLDTPKALAVLWKLIRTYNKNPKKFDPKSVLHTLHEFDKVFGLGFKAIKIEKIPAEILKLARQREGYRKNKEWRKADQLRQEIFSRGYLVEDTSSGPKLKPKKTAR